MENDISIIGILNDSIYQTLPKTESGLNKIGNLFDIIYQREFYSLFTNRVIRELDEIVISDIEFTSFVLNSHLSFRGRISAYPDLIEQLNTIVISIVGGLEYKNYKTMEYTRGFLEQVDVSENDDFDLNEITRGWYLLIVLFHLYSNEVVELITKSINQTGDSNV